MLYIAQHSIDNALAWAARLDGAIHALAGEPVLPVDPVASQRMSLTVRKLVFERTYLVHFWLDDPVTTVRVIGFRHGARLPRPDEP